MTLATSAWVIGRVSTVSTTLSGSRSRGLAMAAVVAAGLESSDKVGASDCAVSGAPAAWDGIVSTGLASARLSMANPRTEIPGWARLCAIPPGKAGGARLTRVAVGFGALDGMISQGPGRVVIVGRLLALSGISGWRWDPAPILSFYLKWGGDTVSSGARCVGSCRWRAVRGAWGVPRKVVITSGSTSSGREGEANLRQSLTFIEIAAHALWPDRRVAPLLTMTGELALPTGNRRPVFGTRAPLGTRTPLPVPLVAAKLRIRTINPSAPAQSTPFRNRTTTSFASAQPTRSNSRNRP